MTAADGSGRPKSRRRLGVVLTALVVAGACAGGIALARGDDGGSVKFEAADPRAGYIMPLDGRERTFTLSSLYIDRPGAEIQVLSVEALTSPNVEYIGALNIWPRDLATNALTVGPGYPAPEITKHHAVDEVVPAAETNLAPMPGTSSPQPLALALGFRLVSGELGAVNGVRVVYNADGEKVEEIFRHALIVCTKPRLCEPSRGESESEYNDRVLNQFGLLPKKS